MSRGALPRSRAAVAGAAAAALSVVAGACSSSPAKPAPAPAPAVALNELTAVPGSLVVGVIVTAEQGEVGYQDLPLAAGAVVARFRLSQSGKSVTLDTVDDHGTAAGAQAAVASLVADGVSGIVYASEGPQVQAGVTAATADHVAVLLPYYTTSVGLPAGAWLTGPDAEQVVSVLSQYASSLGQADPLVISDALGDTYGYLASPFQTVDIIPSDTQQDIDAAVAAKLAAMKAGGEPQAAVVLASATDAASAVAALQAAGISKILLGPAALSPVFGQALARIQGSTNGEATTDATFYSVGENVDDIQTTPAMAGFLSSLRLAAASSSANALGDSALCFNSGGAATADTRSQDAVVALAAAASAARSAAPGAILTQLTNGLKVTSAQGVAGPALDFSAQDAISNDTSPVVALAATAEPDSARATFDQTCPDGQSAPQGSVYAQPVLSWYTISGTGSAVPASGS